MKRRHWLKLGAAAWLGGSRGMAQSSGTLLKAGPFTVKVPEEWASTAKIGHEILNPLYTAADWAAFKKDPAFESKPSYANRPQHWAIWIPAAGLQGDPDPLEDAGDNPVAPQILIHRASEWAVAFTDGKVEKPKAAEVLAQMRTDMDAALTDDKSGFTPAFMDASLTFRSLKKRIDFTGGHGVRMLCQWTIEPEIMRWKQLHYLFIGMSDDDSCQIIATFPVDLPGLPTDADYAHLGRSARKYEELSKGFDDYQKEASQWLEAHAAEITPSLQTLDDMIASLVVRKWE